jgi:hypothetical protein
MLLEFDFKNDTQFNEAQIRCGIELEEERLGRKLNQTEILLIVDIIRSLQTH